VAQIKFQIKGKKLMVMEFYNQGSLNSVILLQTDYKKQPFIEFLDDDLRLKLVFKKG
jgi:hypothetical protein